MTTVRPQGHRRECTWNVYITYVISCLSWLTWGYWWSSVLRRKHHSFVPCCNTTHARIILHSFSGWYHNIHEGTSSHNRFETAYYQTVILCIYFKVFIAISYQGAIYQDLHRFSPYSDLWQYKRVMGWAESFVNTICASKMDIEKMKVLSAFKYIILQRFPYCNVCSQLLWIHLENWALLWFAAIGLLACSVIWCATLYLCLRLIMPSHTVRFLWG